MSLAVLWAMLPSAGRGGSVAPTVVTSTANNLPVTPATVRPDTLVATSLDAQLASTTVVVSPASTEAPPTSDPGTSASLDTTSTATNEPVAQSGTEPIAVGIGDSLLVTTARAIPPGQSSITITGADGQPYEATVVMVDREIGVAVLSAGSAAINSYPIGPAASAGDVVTVVGAAPASANVVADAAGHLVLDAWGDDMAEGTPVLNADGYLVGMCTHGSSGPELVSVAKVAAMLKSTKPAKNDPWMGVHVVAGTHATLTVDSVDPNGPAAHAGIVAGDTIAAIDGMAVTSIEQMRMTISGHAVGDAVTLSIVHADQSTADITITLVGAPSM